MREVLSHKRFMGKFSYFLYKLQIKTKKDSVDSLTKKFVDRRKSNPGMYLFLRLMQPFQFTHCSKCDKPLSHDEHDEQHDKSLCEECDARTTMEAQLESMMEDDKHGPNRRW
jgi:hypothetical protein